MDFTTYPTFTFPRDDPIEVNIEWSPFYYVFLTAGFTFFAVIVVAIVLCIRRCNRRGRVYGSAVTANPTVYVTSAPQHSVAHAQPPAYNPNFQQPPQQYQANIQHSTYPNPQQIGWQDPKSQPTAPTQMSRW